MGEEIKEQNKISELISESLESIKGLVDANTVVGTPINTPQGTVIIPISKISVGFAGGGNDYAGKNSPAKKNNFGGAGGTGVTVSPIGFLVVDAEGKTEMVTMQNPTNSNAGSSIESIVEKLPSILDKLKATFEKKKKAKKEESVKEECEIKTESENGEKTEIKTEITEEEKKSE